MLRDFPIRIGIVCVAAPEDEGNARTAAARVIGDWDWVTDFGVLAHDPRAAVMFEGATVYRPERSLLARSGRELVGRVYAALADSATPVDATVADPLESSPAPDADVQPGEVFTGIGKRRGTRARRSV